MINDLSTAWSERMRLYDLRRDAEALAAPLDEIRSLMRAELRACREYNRLEQRMSVQESVTVYTTKGGYSKWAWTLPVGKVTGEEIMRLLGAPHWGQAVMTRNGVDAVIARDQTYRVPRDIPADTQFRINF